MACDCGLLAVSHDGEGLNINVLVWLHLDLGPDANAPQGDGTNPDYDLMVSGLLSAG